MIDESYYNNWRTQRRHCNFFIDSACSPITKSHASGANDFSHFQKIFKIEKKSTIIDEDSSAGSRRILRSPRISVLAEIVRVNGSI